MSIDYTRTKTIYIVSGVVIILIITLLAQSIYKSHKKYNDGRLIAVRTSRGLIKMNATSIADELAKIQAELSRHEGLERTSKFDIQITNVLDHIKQFIKDNPHNLDVCKGDIKASILNNAMNDRITIHNTDQHLAHAAILSHDDLEYGPDSLRFDYLLRNVDILVHMLKRDVCDGGVIDMTALENLLRTLDADLTQNAEFDLSTGQYSESRFMTDYGKDLATRHDPYAIPRLSLFASNASHIEGFSMESQARGLPAHDDKHYSLGPQNARNAQQRSQMFRENRQKIGLHHYVDEDLLFKPTYNSMAL